MKLLLLSPAFLFLTLTGSAVHAQGPLDSDGDGVPDSEDVCPFVKGTVANKGCPAAEAPKTPAPTTIFIKKELFEDILNNICNNTVQQKVKGKVVNNRVYETSFPKNGPGNNLPVYFEQPRKNNFTVTIGLSNNEADMEAVTVYINGLLSASRACSNGYQRAKLTWANHSKKYSDVLAYDWGGLFFTIETRQEKNTRRVQLKIAKLLNENTPATKPAPPVTPVNECADMETIMDACVGGLAQVKGSLVKSQTPSKYYTTTLPALNLPVTQIVETVNIDVSDGKFNRKIVVYYNTEKDCSTSEEALNKYQKLKATLKKCFSGTANESNEENQKIYEFFIQHKGQTIRACAIYLGLFGKYNVSISFRKT